MILVIYIFCSLKNLNDLVYSKNENFICYIIIFYYTTCIDNPKKHIK